MLLEAEGLRPLLHKVFLVYAGFWVTALVVLFVGVGALLRRYDQAGKGH